MADDRDLINEVKERILERIDLSDKLTDQKLSAVSTENKRDIQGLRDQHEQDKQEAITRSTGEHKNTRDAVSLVGGRVTVVENIIEQDIKPVVDWFHGEGSKFGGRISTLEQLNIKAQAERAQADEDRRLADAEKRGWWKAWGRIGAITTAACGAIGGVVVLIVENLGGIIDLVNRMLAHQGGEVTAGKAKAGGALGVTVALIIAFEGIRFVAYKPTPNDVWTICRGHTMGVKQGDTATEAECDRLTEEEARAALAVVDANVTVKLTDEQRGALGDFVYNEGPQAFKSSTLLEKFNAGNIVAACIDLIDWRKQKDGKGGLVTLDGLVKRRKAEMQYCLGATD